MHTLLNSLIQYSLNTCTLTRSTDILHILTLSLGILTMQASFVFGIDLYANASFSVLTTLNLAFVRSHADILQRI
jgi:hypothetical protein